MAVLPVSPATVNLRLLELGPTLKSESTPRVPEIAVLPEIPATVKVRPEVGPT